MRRIPFLMILVGVGMVIPSIAYKIYEKPNLGMIIFGICACSLAIIVTLIRAIRRFSHGVNKTNELKLMWQKTTIHEYGESRSMKTIKSVNDYIRKFRNKSLYISCSLDGYYIPTADIDSQEDFVKLCAWLSEQSVKWAAIESSHNHYWIFLEMPTKSKKELLEITNIIPVIDKNYKKIVQDFKHPMIRGELKEDGVPPEKIDGNSDNKLLLDFVDMVIKHFHSKRIRWIWRQKLYESGNIDIANPKWGECKGITLNEILNS